MPKLRPFQTEAKRQVYEAWRAGHRVVQAVMPTGAGKTVLFSDIASECPGGVVAEAHRSELILQMSLALARNGVRHRVIGPTSLCKAATSLHMLELGRSFYDPGARVAAAGVDTLAKRDMSHDSWARQVQLQIKDESHHVLKDNKWGTTFDMFPNAYGLFVTATPMRADGKGLGRHADGLVDFMVVGPSMRELIDAGYLTDYRVSAPPGDIDYSKIPIGAGGELSMPKLREAVHASNRIVGDVVKQYTRFAVGKLGVTFAVDVQAAGELAAAYRAAGVPAEVVSAKTPDSLRYAILRRFRAREVLQLVNVDLFGEGFDLPAIEVVSMARRTESYGLYCQQFGRALRLMIDPLILAHWDSYTDAQRLAFIAASGKPTARIIDHVGNIVRHNLPDRERSWSLDRRERMSRGAPADDIIPLRTCLECFAVYERVLRQCPECGTGFVPGARSSPDLVDGDLIDLDPLVLAQLRADVSRVDGAPHPPQDVADNVAGAIRRRHLERQEAQATLRGWMALWAGYQDSLGRTSQSEKERRFYFKFKTDVLSAVALGAREANDLTARVTEELNRVGVVSA